MFASNSDFCIVVDFVNFKLMNSVRLHYLSLKYQRFTPSGFKDIELENLRLNLRLNSLIKFVVHLPYSEMIPKPRIYPLNPCIPSLKDNLNFFVL